MNGKGDTPRPVNMSRYGENYEAVFRHSTKLRTPTLGESQAWLEGVRSVLRSGLVRDVKVTIHDVRKLDILCEALYELGRTNGGCQGGTESVASVSKDAGRPDAAPGVPGQRVAGEQAEKGDRG